MRLKDKVAIITGAGAGIGQATALLFAKEGAKVVVADLDPKAGKEALDQIKKDGGQGVFVQVDVAKGNDVKKMVQETVKHHGKIDILVNNAGIYTKGDVVSTSEEDWDRILDVNLRGVYLCCKYAIPEMINKGGGAIVNIASEAGLVGIKNQVAYNVSKAALIMLTKSMAVDFAPQSIRVNNVCPGTTETPLVRAAIQKEKDPKKARRALEECRPANRLGKPEEIASAILSMASDELGYATGSSLVIDGGYTAQ
ncbi:MAG: SDR family oxidoreductase [Deltaproteobacteria bacterium]|nr:SDR family oxidoreductase [Deltaproteobacteria bacterium]